MDMQISKDIKDAKTVDEIQGKIQDAEDKI